MKLNIDKSRTDYLFNIIEEGNIPKIKEFFHQFPYLINNVNTENDWSPVMYACRYGNIELLLALKEIGFNFEKNSSTMTTLLHLSFYSENMKVIRYLILSLDMCNKEVSQMAKYANVLKKPQILFFFLLNGGYIANMFKMMGEGNSQIPMCFGVYPKEKSKEQIAQNQAIQPQPNIAGAQPPQPKPDQAKASPYQYLSVDKDEDVTNETFILNDFKDESLKEQVLRGINNSRKCLFDIAVQLSGRKQEFKCQRRLEKQSSAPIIDERSIQFSNLADLDPVLQFFYNNQAAFNRVQEFM